MRRYGGTLLNLAKTLVHLHALIHCQKRNLATYRLIIAKGVAQKKKVWFLVYVADLRFCKKFLQAVNNAAIGFFAAYGHAQ